LCQNIPIEPHTSRKAVKKAVIAGQSSHLKKGYSDATLYFTAHKDNAARVYGCLFCPMLCFVHKCPVSIIRSYGRRTTFLSVVFLAATLWPITIKNVYHGRHGRLPLIIIAVNVVGCSVNTKLRINLCVVCIILSLLPSNVVLIFIIDINNENKGKKIDMALGSKRSRCAENDQQVGRGLYCNLVAIEIVLRLLESPFGRKWS
jgi:hypothetical protein